MRSILDPQKVDTEMSFRFGAYKSRNERMRATLKLAHIIL